MLTAPGGTLAILLLLPTGAHLEKPDYVFHIPKHCTRIPLSCNVEYTRDSVRKAPISCGVAWLNINEKRGTYRTQGKDATPIKSGTIMNTR
jgi:hypothetical protein